MGVSKNQKELRSKLQKLAHKYQVCAQKIIGAEEEGSKLLMLGDFDKSEYGEYVKVEKNATLSEEKRFIARINSVLLALGPEEANILYYEYFFPLGSKWWMNYTSSPAFYRNKRLAVRHFWSLYESEDNF